MKINDNIALEWLQEILHFESVEGVESENAPFGLELRKCLDYSLNLLNNLGFSTKDVEGYCGYGEVGEGELFGILCHLDVVPVGDGWTFPPFSATLSDNKIYARGALDDKGPFICCLYAVAKLLEEGLVPKKRIRFILGCDEESGWKCMDRYQETEEMPVLGISPDSDFPVINCEKGIVYHKISMNLPKGILKIRGGERANMVPDKAIATLSSEIYGDFIKNSNIDYVLDDNGDYIISFYGKSNHGSAPKGGVNAIYKLFKFLGQKEPEFQELFEIFSSHNGEKIGLNLVDEISGILTLNLGTINIVNDKIVMELDIRYPISYDKDQVTSILKNGLPNMEIEQVFFHKPLYVAEDHYLVKTLLNAYNKVMKVNAKPITIGGGTYARVLPLGVAFGPVFPGSKAKIHCVDEYIDLDEFYTAAKIYYYAIKELCF
ncbi:MAG: Sapep family Mn(2+)-dependent dipeptidase [Clostridia bacterium]